MAAITGRIVAEDEAIGGDAFEVEPGRGRDCCGIVYFPGKTVKHERGIIYLVGQEGKRQHDIIYLAGREWKPLLGIIYLAGQEWKS